MQNWADSWSWRLLGGGVVGLSGPLGAGKTTLVGYLARALGSQDLVSSPTFALVHEYEGKLPIVHMDLYRLGSPEEFLELEETYIRPKALVLIEWPQRAGPYLPPLLYRLELSFHHQGRRLEILP